MSSFCIATICKATTYDSDGFYDRVFNFTETVIVIMCPRSFFKFDEPPSPGFFQFTIQQDFFTNIVTQFILSIMLDVLSGGQLDYVFLNFRRQLVPVTLWQQRNVFNYMSFLKGVPPCRGRGRACNLVIRFAQSTGNQCNVRVRTSVYAPSRVFASMPLDIHVWNGIFVSCIGRDLVPTRFSLCGKWLNPCGVYPTRALCSCLLCIDGLQVTRCNLVSLEAASPSNSIGTF